MGVKLPAAYAAPAWSLRILAQSVGLPCLVKGAHGKHFVHARQKPWLKLRKSCVYNQEGAFAGRFLMGVLLPPGEGVARAHGNLKAAHYALPVVGVQAGKKNGIPFFEHGVQGRGAFCLHHGFEFHVNALVYCRNVRNPVQEPLEIHACSAHKQRNAPLFQNLVHLAQGHVHPGLHINGPVCCKKAVEVVGSLRLFRGIRLGSDDGKILVHLARVRVDDFAAKSIGKTYGKGSLACTRGAGKAEDASFFVSFVHPCSPVFLSTKTSSGVFLA